MAVEFGIHFVALVAEVRTRLWAKNGVFIEKIVLNINKLEFKTNENLNKFIELFEIS